MKEGRGVGGVILVYILRLRKIKKGNQCRGSSDSRHRRLRTHLQQQHQSTAAVVAHSSLLWPVFQRMEKRISDGVLASDPKLVGMIQNKLGTLVGKSSGYIESLPEAVQRRIVGLKGVQHAYSKMELQFQEEILQLEKKYLERYRPLYARRMQIITGQAEPTEEEIAASGSEVGSRG